MIKVTRLDGRELVINARLIKYVEKTPDTVITLVTRDKILVKEPVEDIIEKVVRYYKSIERGID